MAVLVEEGRVCAASILADVLHEKSCLRTDGQEVAYSRQEHPFGAQGAVSALRHLVDPRYLGES